MRMDPRVLVDSFEYQEYIGENRYGGIDYEEPLTVINCRIDRNTVFSKDVNDTRVVADAVIFCYHSQTAPFKAFKEQSKVIFDGIERTIKKVVYVTNPYDNRAFAYELEVK